ncbi:cell division protein ZapE [Herbiconiux sp. YIM B11900]|uniref:cell division protein ZapE n=1 Tax=Herbiconiux sp. YIM B11900 TaxID=3404131 RepID=UPI003F841F1F
MLAVDHEAAAAGFELDAGQRAVLARLEVLAAELARAAEPAGSGEVVDGVDDPPPAGAPRGVYLWGPVGRGKTWLLDAFVRVLPAASGPVRRVHSHGFFDALHRELFVQRGRDPQHRQEAFERTLRELVGDARLLVFDEFHVDDPGNATLLVRVLHDLRDDGVALLLSSNQAPEELLPDPVRHHLMEPGIRLIRTEMDVLELAGEVDYRQHADGRSAGRRDGFAAGAWVHGGALGTPDAESASGTGAATDAEAALAALGLRSPGPDEATELRIGGRSFEVTAARPGELWVSFEQLCLRPLSTMEYLDWADRFGERWVITGVPGYGRLARDAQLRFLTAVDVLSDAGVPTVMLAEVSRDEQIAAVARAGDARLASRLALLRVCA